MLKFSKNNEIDKKVTNVAEVYMDIVCDYK